MRSNVKLVSTFVDSRCAKYRLHVVRIPARTWRSHQLQYEAASSFKLTGGEAVPMILRFQMDGVEVLAHNVKVKRLQGGYRVIAAPEMHSVGKELLFCFSC